MLPPDLRADEATVDREAEFQAQLDAGLAHYEERRYAEAAAAFEAAYAIRAEPELAYNIARSYERAVMREEAIAAYDRFLGLPGTTSEMRNRARSARSSLRAEVEALAASMLTLPPAYRALKARLPELYVEGVELHPDGRVDLTPGVL